MKYYFYTFLILLFSCENSSKNYSQRTATNRRFNEIKSIIEVSDIKDYPELMNQLQNGNTDSYKLFSKDKVNDLIVFDNNLASNFMLDGWGSRIRITAAHDFSLIIVCSNGPNMQFDHYGGDDEILVIDMSAKIRLRD
jgi:hypothetical protein